MRPVRLVIIGLLSLVLSVTLIPLPVFAQNGSMEKFTSEDGRLTLEYPEGWAVVESQGLVLVSNKASAMLTYLKEETVDSGNLVMLIYPPALVQKDLAGADLPTNADPEEVLRAILDHRNIDTRDMTIDSEGEFAIGIALSADSEIDRIMTLIRLDQGTFVLVDSFTSRFEILDFIDTISAVSGSIHYEGVTISKPDVDQPSVALAQTYTWPDNLFSFQYPAGWFVRDFSPDKKTSNQLLMMATSEDLITRTPKSADEIVVFVAPPAFIQELAAGIMPGHENDLAVVSRIFAVSITVVLDNAELSESADFIVNGHPAERIDGKTLSNDITVIVVDLGGGTFVGVVGVFDTGALDSQVKIVQSIAGSVALPTSITSTPAPGHPPQAGNTPAPAATGCQIQVTGAPVNKRGGPGTGYDIVGSLSAGTVMTANGRFISPDGYVWVRLSDDSWVRLDVVSATGDCAHLPDIKPGS